MRAVLLEEKYLGVVFIVFADLARIGLQLGSLGLKESEDRVDQGLVLSCGLFLLGDLIEKRLILRHCIYAGSREVLFDDQLAEVGVF